MKDETRILFVTHSLDRGGSPISLWNLCRSLPSHHRVLASEKDGALRTRYEAENVKIHILPRYGPLELGLVLACVRLMRKERIQLVHLNTLTSYYKYPALAARWLRIPVVWFIRENVRERRCLKLHSWIKSYSTRIVPVSHEIARALFPGEVPDKVRVVYNGISPEPPAPLKDPIRTQLGIASNTPLIGCIAALEERKGVADLVPALKQLHQLGVHAHVVCLGVDRSRSQAYKTRLESLAQQAGLQRHFHLLGDFANPTGALLEFDAFALPTEWEGCARTILEAMLCKCPIVTTSAGGNPEMVEHHVHGWIYPPRDVNGLAEGLFRVLTNRAVADRFRHAAHAELLRRFTLEHHVNNVLSVYDEALANANAGRSR